MKSITTAVLLGLILSFSVPSLAVAETSSSSTEALTKQITTLLQQIKTLNEQILTLKSQQKELSSQLTKTLEEGSEGDQVAVLQALLAADPSLYPEKKITGYFGKLTSDAVKRFQKKYDIEQVGSVGPKTRKKLNELLEKHPLEFAEVSATSSIPGTVVYVHEGKKEKFVLCVNTPPGHLIAPGWLKKHDGEDDENAGKKKKNHGDEDDSIIPRCHKLPYGIAKKLDLVNGTTTKDTTAPVISSISSVVTHQSATIQLVTNEPTKAEIAYGTTSAYGFLSPISFDFSINHTQMLSGLLPSTLYHYQVKVKDKAGNWATSSDQTFTTASAPDTTAPVLSSLVLTPATTSVQLSWTTNEPTTSKVYYSTMSPVDPSGTTTLLVSNTSLVTSHLVSLQNLSTSTAYHLLLVAKDQTGNQSTTTATLTTTAS